MVDVYTYWSTDWQSKVLETWEVTQLKLLRQESVKVAAIREE